MPKRPRQAHVPQQPRKRKARRQPGTAAPGTPGEDEAPVFAEAPPLSSVAGAYGDASGPVETRPHRRVDRLVQSRERVSVRAVPGQLPTYERSYIMAEMRSIGIISGGLLAVVLVLAVVLR